MSARILPKYLSRPRVELGTVLPLDTPYSIELELSTICNLKCKFCYHSDGIALSKAGFKYELMNFELFTKLIDDIKGFPNRIKKLKLYVRGEPLTNPHIVDMIKYARLSDMIEEIELTTNGILLNEELSKKLIIAGLQRVNLSICGLSGEEYLKMAGKEVDFPALVNNIKTFHSLRDELKSECTIHVKLLSHRSSEKAYQDDFFGIFGDISDEVFVENICAFWQDIDYGVEIDNSKGLYNQELKRQKVCTFLFTKMLIASNGGVMSCVGDWKAENLVGDANKDSLIDIWNNSAFRAFRIKHLRGERDSIQICKNCIVFAGTPDNIDDFTDDILKRMEED